MRSSATRLSSNFFLPIQSYRTLRPDCSILAGRSIFNHPQCRPTLIRHVRPTSRQQSTHTFREIRNHRYFKPTLIILTLIFDVTYGLAIYTTGGLDDSPISPFNDPVIGGTVSWLFRRPVKQALHPNEFRTFELVDKERVSETSSILTLQPAHPGGVKEKPDPYAAFWEKGIWSVEIKQPQLQIARRYTPLPPLSSTNTEPEDPADSASQPRLPSQTHDTSQNLTLLVRRDPTGEVSNYLHRLPIGGRLDIRGGYTEYELPKDITEVLFLAGGTGVAPAMQVAYTLARRYVHRDNDGVGMQLLWANRHREECDGGVQAANTSMENALLQPAMPKPGATSRTPTTPNALTHQLASLEEAGTCLRLSTTYFIDSEATFITREAIATALASLSTSPGEVPSRPQGKKLILVSGPDGFVEWLAGPRRYWNGVEATGVTGGILGGMDLRGWEVRKL